MRDFDNPSCRVCVELAENRAIIHCTWGDSWSLKVYRKALYLWDKINTDLINMGVRDVYAALPDDKIRRFSLLFGFEPTGDGIHMDGKLVELYRYKLR